MYGRASFDLLRTRVLSTVRIRLKLRACSYCHFTKCAEEPVDIQRRHRVLVPESQDALGKV